MFAGNLLQVGLWAGLFMAFNEFNDVGTAYYHSLVNFSILGYGDLVMSAKVRILGGHGGGKRGVDAGVNLKRLDMLEDRYSRGEIDPEESRQKKRLKNLLGILFRNPNARVGYWRQGLRLGVPPP